MYCSVGEVDIEPVAVRGVAAVACEPVLTGVTRRHVKYVVVTQLTPRSS